MQRPPPDGYPPPPGGYQQPQPPTYGSYGGPVAPQPQPMPGPVGPSPMHAHPGYAPIAGASGAAPTTPQWHPAMQPAPVGLFGRFPCPYCGTPTTSHAEGGNAARWAGGLVGWLIITAISAKHFCLHHGEIPTHAFPPPHRSAMTTRTVLKLGAGVALLVVVSVLLFVIET